MIAMGLSRDPPWLLSRNGRGHEIPVKVSVCRQRRVDSAESCLMRHSLSKGNLALTRLGELRPVIGNPGIHVNVAVFQQMQQGQGGHGFAHRPDVDERIFQPGPGSVGIPITGPQVDHQFAFIHNGHRRPELVALRKILHKASTHGFKFRIAVAMNHKITHAQASLRVLGHCANPVHSGRS